MPTSDLTLWERFIKGDEEAYACIYDRYVEALYAYGACFTQDKCLLEDCIHDLFVKLYRNHRKLRATNNIKFYLFMGLKRQLLNAFRNAKSTVEIEEIEPKFSVAYTAEDQMIDQEHVLLRRERVMKMLDMLNSHQREVIYYRFEEGLSYEEIAAIMYIKPQSAQNIMQRALKKLRDSFSAEDFLFFLLYFYQAFE